MKARSKLESEEANLVVKECEGSVCWVVGEVEA